MSIWTIDSRQDHDVYTVVYLLKDALRSALEDALFCERTSFPKPDVKGAGHAEISARLGRFRDACNVFREREALMLTKLLRARTWASELRKLSPEFQEEVDQFVEATEPCHKLQAEFMRDAQRMFHGGGSLSRFFSRRQSETAEQEEVAANSQSSNQSADHAKILELRVACEVFLAQVNTEFFANERHGESALHQRAVSVLISRGHRGTAGARDCTEPADALSGGVTFLLPSPLPQRDGEGRMRPTRRKSRLWQRGPPP